MSFALEGGDVVTVNVVPDGNEMVRGVPKIAPQREFIVYEVAAGFMYQPAKGVPAVQLVFFTPARAWFWAKRRFVSSVFAAWVSSCRAWNVR